MDEFDEFEDITGGSADGDYHGSSAYDNNMPEEFDLDSELGDDDWLSNAEEEVKDIEGRDPRMGMATAADLMTGRFSHMEAGVREAAKNITGNKVPAYMGFDPIDILAAIEGFSSTIEGSAEAWGKALPSTEGKLGGEVTRIDPVTMQPISTFQPDVSRQDYVVALSMLGTTADEYLKKGAGENLLGHSLIGERNDKSNEDFERAVKISGEISALYLSDATKGSDIGGDRLLAVQNDVIARAISSVGVSTLGLPNELSTHGLVRTQIYGGTGQGTAMTSEQHKRKFSKFTVKNADGFQELIAGTPEHIVKDYWGTKPSLKDSLFPLTKSTKNNPIPEDVRANEKKLQQIQYDKLMEDAKFMRDTFRIHLTGETKGFASRTINDRTLGEYAETSYLRDEAARVDLGYEAATTKEAAAAPVYGGSSMVTTSQSNSLFIDGKIDVQAALRKIELNKSFASVKPTTGNTTTRLQGSERGGMYGEKDLTESDVFVEEGRSLDQIIAEEEREAAYQFGPVQMTDREAYLRESANSGSAAQGTKEWLAEREGHVTASMFVGTSAEHKAEDLAIKLASERMGIKGFEGNSDTQEGNDSEDKAAFAMMAHLNSGKPKNERMQFEEAFFFKGPEGMGASVDGRMFTADGSSAGNVELKYLAGGSVEGARKKYYEQMQFQMLMNEETQTHFGVLNKDTNQFHYELIHADPKTQAALRASAEEALEAQGDITAKDIQAMNKARKRKPTQPVERSTGQKKAYEEVVPEVEEAMVAFDPTGAIRPSAPSYSARDSAFGQKLMREEQAAVDKKITKEISDSGDKAQAKAKAAQALSAGYRPDAFAGIDAKPVDHGYADEIKELAEAAKDSSQALKGFKNALGTVGTVATELANRLLKGNEEGMDVTRLASATGLGGDAALGLRDELRSSGLSASGAVSAMKSASAQSRAFSNPVTAGAELGRMSRMAAATDNGLVIPNSLVEGKLNAQEYLAMAEEQVQAAGLGPEERAYALREIFKVPDMTNFRGTPEDISGATKSLNEESLRTSNEAIQGVTQKIEAGERYLSNGGAEVAAAAKVVSEVAKSPTGSTFMSNLTTGVTGLATGAGGVALATKAGTIMTAAKSTAAATMTKSASVLGRMAPLARVAAGPVAIAGTGAYIAANAGEGSEYSMGSLFGENGFTEFMDTPISEHLGFGEDIVPERDIGKIAATTRDSAKTSLNSNVEVNVVVNPDSVSTEVNDNGFITMDQDNSLGLGG